MILLYKNDNLIEVDELKDEVSGDFLNLATVTAILKDSAGAAIGSTITLTYVSSSNGKYQGTVPDDLIVNLGDRITAEITADSGADKRAFWCIALVVEKKGGIGLRAES